MEALTTGPRDQRRCSVLDVPVDACRDVTASAIGLHADGGGQIVTLNAEMTMTARRNPDLGAVISAAALVVPDGAGVVWALSRQGIRVQRSPGIELAWSLLSYAAAHGWRVALVGASPQVMETLCDRLSLQFPTLQLDFAEHGYQDASAWPELETRLRRLSPDLVLVALGVPLQEIWIQRMRDQLPGLWMGVGGSFDVRACIQSICRKQLCGVRCALQQLCGPCMDISCKDVAQRRRAGTFQLDVPFQCHRPGAAITY